MADDKKIKIPDIGGATDVDVIEIMVKAGDQIKKDQSIIMLESDKASMEIPSPAAGTVESVSIRVGDKVSEGDVILTLRAENTPEPIESTKKEPEPKPEPVVIPETKVETQSIEVKVPDIGGATDVDVIEIMVSPGQHITKEQSVITLEGDKATMDIPAPASGLVESVSLKVGDKVSQGTLILKMKSSEPTVLVQTPVSEVTQTEEKVLSAPVKEDRPLPNPVSNVTSEALVFAGPSVRRLAREFGVDLSQVKGSGRKARLTKEDIQAYVKAQLSAKPSAGGFSLPTAPVIDFSKFGAIETKPLNKIKRLTGVNVHRSWVTIPHVTQFDEADITDLEAFRKAESQSSKETAYKLTILAFVVKVAAKALKAFPQFNASLDASGENLIYKQYCHIGIAVETPNGLVVPVIKDADKLSIGEIALEMSRLSQKARDKGLSPADMSGGCFTISSLGGIGGTAFTPIVNAPEVAILGLSRSSIKPVFDQDMFKPRLMLPLSLSYDHRVIDGAEAARFTRYIADSLADIRRILL